MAKVYTHFQTKTNVAETIGTYLYGSYEGVSPQDSDKHLFTLLFYFIIEGHVICDGTFQKTLRAIGFKPR